MKFSVIIPVYNGELFIKRAILSLINQKYQNLEIIIINDGSTDNSENIVLELKKEYEKHEIIYQKTDNKGPSNARNTGIRLATGNYICFLDADDYYEDIFEDILKKEQDFDLCFFGWKEVDEHQHLVNHYDDKFQFIKESITGKEACIKKYNKEIWICNCNFVCKLDLIKEKNLFYPENIYSGEDTYFIYSVLINCNKVLSVEKNAFININRSNSLMHSNFSEKFLTEFIALENLIAYFKKIEADFELTKRIEALYVYAKISVSKKIIRSYGVIQYRKIYQKNIKLDAKMYKNLKKYFTRIQKIEFNVLSFSKTLFYFLTKIYDFKKGGRK